MMRLSVVIPTCQRREVVCDNVRALSAQSLAPEQFEVIIVADGCTDGTAAALRALQLPFVLTVIEQPGCGAASARNAGAKAASGDVLVFLDDDMRPHRDVLAGHLEAQQREPALYVGHFTTPLSYRTDSPNAASVNAWWDHRFHLMMAPGHRFSFTDVCTGHMSVARSGFVELGGFDEAIGHWAGEDYEFGFRWIASGRSLRYLAAARTEHLDRPSVAKGVRRAYQEGRGHVRMARRHAELLVRLPLEAGLDGRLRFGRFRWQLLTHARARALAARWGRLAGLAEQCKARGWFKRSFRRARLASYWHGVLDETGGWDGFAELVQNAVLLPQQRPVLEMDLAEAMPWQDSRSDRAAEGAVGITLGGRPLAWLEAAPGDEAVRWPHVASAIAAGVSPLDWFRWVNGAGETAMSAAHTQRDDEAQP